MLNDWYSCINGMMGMMVERNINAMRIGFWCGMYCFLTNRGIHSARAIANAPMNMPTMTTETPRYAAPTANAPAPTVQSGQCAFAVSGVRRTKSVGIMNTGFFIERSCKIQQKQSQDTKVLWCKGAVNRFLDEECRGGRAEAVVYHCVVSVVDAESSESVLKMCQKENDSSW